MDIGDRLNPIYSSFTHSPCACRRSSVKASGCIIQMSFHFVCTSSISKSEPPNMYSAAALQIRICLWLKSQISMIWQEFFLSHAKFCKSIVLRASSWIVTFWRYWVFRKLEWWALRALALSFLVHQPRVTSPVILAQTDTMERQTSVDVKRVIDLYHIKYIPN